MVDVTDLNFEAEVLDRSMEVPVIVDLWAEWCGPCKTLGPILERVVAATNGAVVLAKIDVDSNPRSAATFEVQSIPAVHALYKRKKAGSFVGAQSEPYVAEFVSGLMALKEPTEVEQLLAVGDRASIEAALALEPANEAAILALAELCIAEDNQTEALDLLAKVPETSEVRRLAALARTAGNAPQSAEAILAELTELLSTVKGNEENRQRFVDLLERLGTDHPSVPDLRRQLMSRLY